MIRINLVRKKKPGIAAAGGKAGGDLGENLRSLSSGETTKSVVMLVFRLGIPVLVGLAANYGFDYYVEQKQIEMSQELKDIEAEKGKIEKKLAEFSGFEEKKKSLEQSQAIIRKKIETIEKLVRNRDFSAKSMISLAQAIPGEAWLTELNQVDHSFSIRGASSDAAIVSDFMMRLQKTIYFKDVQLKRTVASDPTGTKSDFELAGRSEE